MSGEEINNMENFADSSPKTPPLFYLHCQDFPAPFIPDPNAIWAPPIFTSHVRPDQASTQFPSAFPDDFDIHQDIMERLLNPLRCYFKSDQTREGPFQYQYSTFGTPLAIAKTSLYDVSPFGKTFYKSSDLTNLQQPHMGEEKNFSYFLQVQMPTYSSVVAGLNAKSTADDRLCIETSQIQLQNLGEPNEVPTVQQQPRITEEETAPETPKIVAAALQNTAAETHKLLQQVNNILTTLSAEMVNECVMKIKYLSINTEQGLRGLVHLIFEKALKQPSSSGDFAHLCHCLMELKVPSTQNAERSMKFYKLLIKACQKEFEKDKDETVEQLQKELATATGEETEPLELELKEAKTIAFQRSLNNIRFICELFKVNIIHESTMHLCISKLLQDVNELNTKRLCRLMFFAGEVLDFKNKLHMDEYFNYMKLVIKEGKANNVICFMIKGLLDLRKNDWIPRRLRI